MSIAERLNSQLRERHITPYQLSKDTGVNQSLIGRILNGDTDKPRLASIMPIAEYLGVTPDWLYYGEELSITPNEAVDYQVKLNELADKVGKAIEDFTTAQAGYNSNIANILSIINTQKEVIQSQQRSIEILSESVRKLSE